MKAHPNDLILIGSSAKTLFRNKVTLTGTEGEDSHIFLEDTIQLVTAFKEVWVLRFKQPRVGRRPW